MFLVYMLRTGCYVKQMKSIKKFNPSSVIYIIAQVNSSTIANICCLIQTFKYQCCGFQMYFKSILVYNLKTKREFWSNCPHYVMGYIRNLGPMFFLFSLVLNLAYIDYSLYQIWSVYIQYLRRCDHSNNCLFLAVQQAEVLLKFFWWVYMFGECTCYIWARACQIIEGTCIYTHVYIDQFIVCHSMYTYFQLWWEKSCSTKVQHVHNFVWSIWEVCTDPSTVFFSFSIWN